ncbi:sulfite oxidase [Amycolatopsis xylanica]|nr:sulfite oxidase [Amycolatopsis xylanica]
MNELTYDKVRAAQWFSRRTLFRLSAGVAATAALPGTTGSALAEAPIVKPLPPEFFEVYGTNAETRWEAFAGSYLTPIERFFVRDHTSTPLIDADTWRLKLFGTGLRGAPTLANAIEFSYRDLRALPSETITAAIECAGNGRSFFTSQQGQTVSGTPWKLGGIGVARWRGVRLATVLKRAGLTRHAVDVLPQGLDPEYQNLGRVRRPLPVSKALQDVLLAYEMNGEPLPPDHGFPVRLVVPSWIGIASIKWVGQIEVADEPLFSPWNTQFYRLTGPGYPAEGELMTEQVAKSAFELRRDAEFAAGRTHVLRGRSWSPHGRIKRIEVSTDDGATWRCANPVGPVHERAWQCWELRWRPSATGTHVLRARATDITGATQPDVAPFNTQGYLFGAVVRHPVRVV